MTVDDPLYREEILELADDTSHRGRLDHADFSATQVNPLCGDLVRLQLQLADSGLVEKARFEGQGCVISQAAAALLTRWVESKSIDEMSRLRPHDVIDQLGITPSPARMKCALLAWKSLRKALQLELEV